MPTLPAPCLPEGGPALPSAQVGERGEKENEKRLQLSVEACNITSFRHFPVHPLATLPPPAHSLVSTPSPQLVSALAPLHLEAQPENSTAARPASGPRTRQRIDAVGGPSDDFLPLPAVASFFFLSLVWAPRGLT